MPVADPRLIRLAGALAVAVLNGSLAAAPADAQSSSLDTMRTRATSLFGPALAGVRADVDRVEIARRRYEAACHGRITATRPIYPQGIPLDHPLIGEGALVATRGLPQQSAGSPLRFEIRNETTPECLMLRSDITSGVTSIEHRLADISEDARRAGIYPGVLRELRQANGLSPID